MEKPRFSSELADRFPYASEVARRALGLVYLNCQIRQTANSEGNCVCIFRADAGDIINRVSTNSLTYGRAAEGCQHCSVNPEAVDTKPSLV